MFETMKARNHYMVGTIGLLMVGVFFLPIWYIGLDAPMYPEGLSLNIWLTRITGGEEFDLNNINLLNHYVGMREIDHTMFPEFRFMPFVLGYMILGALVTFFFNRRFMALLGLANFFLVAGVGFYDFWRWEYDYGHNLKPGAPLSIPGMAYQPPLLGCKELLNFVSCSWPHAGGGLLLLAGALLAYICFDEYRTWKAPKV